MKTTVGILALDLGTRTGVASGVFDISSNVVWNKEKMVKQTEVEHFELPSNTYLSSLKEQVRKRMQGLVQEDGMVIVVPQPTFGRKVIARHWKMIGVIEQLAEEHGNTTVFEVLDNHVRKVVCGSVSVDGNKSKYERRMLRKQMVMLRYGSFVHTDDEADALMFLEWYLTSRI